MICDSCDEEVTGKSYTRTIATCHPTVTYLEIEVCFKCKHFPHNNIDSKKTLIK